MLILTQNFTSSEWCFYLCNTCSCGLDALMLVKTMTLSIQLLVPITFFGLVVCEYHVHQSLFADRKAGHANACIFFHLNRCRPALSMQKACAHNLCRLLVDLVCSAAHPRQQHLPGE